MKLKDIIAIGGKPGLYRFIAQAKNGIIVESLTEGKRFPAYASEKVSALEDVAIFTDADEVSLSSVFDTIFDLQEGEKAISHKSSGEELKAYFAQILPDYDRDRVYVSDMKKVISWYNQLQELNLLEKEEEKEASPDVEDADDQPESKDENPEKPEIKAED